MGKIEPGTGAEAYKRKTYEPDTITSEMPSRIGIHPALKTIHTDIEQLTLSMFSETEQSDLKKDNVSQTGLNLSAREYQAMIALGVIMEKVKYPQVTNLGDRTPLQDISFTPAQYLNAYGVKKIKTKRGKEEHSRSERKNAITALWNLFSKTHCIKYSFKDKAGKTRCNRDVMHLVEDISQDEDTRKLTLRPHRYLVFEYQQYYFLISPVVRQKIKTGWKKPTPALYNLLILFMQKAVFKQNDFYFELNELGKKIGFEKLVADNQKTLLEKKVSRLLSGIKKAGWIEDFGIYPEKGQLQVAVRLIPRELLIRLKQ